MFKQFAVRNSFTIEESKLKKWKKESILGKRSFEGKGEESKGEVSLITDLKGLERYEEKLKEDQIRNSKKKPKNSQRKFISDFFGEQNFGNKERKRGVNKRYISSL